MTQILKTDIYPSVRTVAFTDGMTYGRVYEDTGAHCMARILDFAPTASTDYLQQADVSALTYAVYNLDSLTPTTAIVSGTLTVASQVYNTLQTDGRWQIDSTGYNFRHMLTKTAFPTGDARYRVEYTFTGSSTPDMMVPFEIFVIESQTS